MTLVKLLAKKRISRQLFLLGRLNGFETRSQIENYFWEHGSFKELQECNSEQLQELEELIDANLIRVGRRWEMPRDLLRSRSLVRIADFLLEDQLLPGKHREVLVSCFRIYQDTPQFTPAELARELGYTETSILRLRKLAVQGILRDLPSLQGLGEDLLANYGLDVTSELITIDEARAQQVNERAGTGFTPQFLGLLLGIYLEKDFRLLGRTEEVLAGNYLSIRHLWSGFYLLRKDIAEAMDVEALVEEAFRLKHGGSTRSLNFKNFVSHFLKAAHRSQIELFLPIAAELLLRELGLRVEKEKLLFQARKPFLLVNYTKEALNSLGKPSRQEVVRQKVEELHPGFMVDRNRFDLVMLEKWGFTRYKNLFGLKEWYPEGNGKLKDQDPAMLKELEEELPVRTGDYWKLHWEQKFSELKAFTDLHERLPEKEGPVEEKKLVDWLRRQMAKVRKGELDAQQLAQYKEFRERFPVKLGKYFNAHWDFRYGQLNEFAQTHSRPPRKTGPGEEAGLYKWLINQKIKMKKGTLNLRKKTLIRDFDARYPLRKPKIIREQDYQRLIRFTEIYGRLPKQNAVEEEQELNYFWLKQLEKMKQGKLVRHHEALLKNLKRKYPYDATHHKEAWYKRMEELKAFTQAQGLPQGHQLSGEAKTLRGWLIFQRVRMNKGELDAGQEQLLKAFDEQYVVKVDRKEEWGWKFLELEEFAQKHSRLPKENEEEGFLYRWLMTQRWLMKKGELDKDQKERLVELNVRYPLKTEVYRKVAWYENFEELQQFAQAHSRLPDATLKEERKLYAWLKKEQLKGRRGKLDSIQRSRLQELVERYPVVNKVEEHWQARFRELQEFFEKHSRLPKSRASKKESSLHYWFKQQDNRRERGKLHQQKAILIKNIGSRFLRMKPEWEERFEEVKLFAETHLRIPKRTAVDGEELALNHWFQGQKERLRKGRLGKWQAELVRDLVARYGTGPGRSKPRVFQEEEEEEEEV